MLPSSLTNSRWKKILLLQLVVWPALLLVAEVAVRLGTDYSSDATRTEFLELVEAVTTGVPDAKRNASIEALEVGELILHPYTGFGTKYLVSSHTREIQRAREEQPENEYRIMVLGGSVAGGFGNLASAGVRALRNTLMADPRFEGRSIRILPQGSGSFKQPQQLDLANYLLASGVRPHAIINLDGFNEVALAMQNAAAGMQPTYPSFSNWVHLANDWGTDTDTMVEALLRINDARDSCVEFSTLVLETGLHHSSLLGPIALDHMRRLRASHGVASKNYVQLLQRRPGLGPLTGPKTPTDEATVLHDAVRMWSECSVSLDALCRARGIFYLHVLQPTLHDPGSKPLTPVEIRKGEASDEWIRGAEDGYPLLREAGALLRERGLHFVDGSMAFREIKRTLYYDACHFEEFGNAILGRLIGAAFLADL